jgi:hypothetical protein
MGERRPAPIEAAALEPVLRPLELARTLPGQAYASAAARTTPGCTAWTAPAG